MVSQNGAIPPIFVPPGYISQVIEENGVRRVVVVPSAVANMDGNHPLPLNTPPFHHLPVHHAAYAPGSHMNGFHQLGHVHPIFSHQHHVFPNCRPDALRFMPRQQYIQDGAYYIFTSYCYLLQFDFNPNKWTVSACIALRNVPHMSQYVTLLTQSIITTFILLCTVAHPRALGDPNSPFEIGTAFIQSFNLHKYQNFGYNGTKAVFFYYIGLFEIRFQGAPRSSTGTIFPSLILQIGFGSTYYGTTCCFYSDQRSCSLKVYCR